MNRYNVTISGITTTKNSDLPLESFISSMINAHHTQQITAELVKTYEQNKFTDNYYIVPAPVKLELLCSACNFAVIAKCYISPMNDHTEIFWWYGECSNCRMRVSIPRDILKHLAPEPGTVVTERLKKENIPDYEKDN